MTPALLDARAPARDRAALEAISDGKAAQDCGVHGLGGEREMGYS